MSERGKFNVISPDAEIASDVKIGNFCTIEAGAKIGRGVQIGHSCIIEGGVEIGASTRLRSHVELRRGTKIGADCYIDSGVKVSGNARIGDRVTLRYDTIVARGCDIGAGSYISPQTMFQNLDHEKEAVGGAHIGKDCFIGTNVTFSEGIRVADNVLVGSKSMVTKSLEEPGYVYFGIPAVKIRRAFTRDRGAWPFPCRGCSTGDDLMVSRRRTSRAFPRRCARRTVGRKD